MFIPRGWFPGDRFGATLSCVNGIRPTIVTAAAAAAMVLAACGGSGAGSPTRTPTLSTLPSPTASVTASRTTTAEPPTSDRTETAQPPAQTTTSDSTQTAVPPPGQTSTRTEVVTRTETQTATTQPTTQSTTESAPVANESAAPVPAAADDTSSSTPAWVWWLLGLILLGAVIATALVLHRRNQKRAWAGRFAAAQGEVVWLARDAVPRMAQAPTPAQMAGGWRIEGPRVAALQDALTTLEATALDDPDRSRATTLRDAVRTSSMQLSALDTIDNPAAAMGLLQSAAAGLETALAAIGRSARPPQAPAAVT